MTIWQSGWQVSKCCNKHEKLWCMGVLRHMVQCFCQVLRGCKYTKTGSGNGSNDSNEKRTSWRCMYFLLTMRPLRPMSFSSFLLQNGIPRNSNRLCSNWHESTSESMAIQWFAHVLFKMWVILTKKDFIQLFQVAKSCVFAAHIVSLLSLITSGQGEQTGWASLVEASSEDGWFGGHMAYGIGYDESEMIWAWDDQDLIKAWDDWYKRHVFFLKFLLRMLKTLWNMVQNPSDFAHGRM